MYTYELVKADPDKISKELSWKMNYWIIITPEGITTSPTDVMNDNFQVLGFVDTISEVAAVEKLKNKGK
jgi:hypothetical protein